MNKIRKIKMSENVLMVIVPMETEETVVIRTGQIQMLDHLVVSQLRGHILLQMYMMKGRTILHHHLLIKNSSSNNNNLHLFKIIEIVHQNENMEQWQHQYEKDLSHMMIAHLERKEMDHQI